MCFFLSGIIHHSLFGSSQCSMVPMLCWHPVYSILTMWLASAQSLSFKGTYILIPMISIWHIFSSLQHFGSLFTILNGDDLYVTFEESDSTFLSSVLEVFSKFYLAFFVFVFIYIVLSLFIGIFSHAYESLSVSACVSVCVY